MTTTDTNEAAEEGGMSDSARDDESIPFAVKVMIVLILLVILGVVLVDILHFVGAF